MQCRVGSAALLIAAAGVEVEGIFRKTGAAKEVTAMVESIANGTSRESGERRARARAVLMVTQTRSS